MKIAIAGKGGSGKSLLAGGLAFLLARSGHTVLAIDADPAPSLGALLGLSPREADAIVPVSKNAGLIAAKTGTAYPGVYALNFPVSDVVKKYAVATPAGPHLLVMGTVTSMGAGCTCPANSVVRALLRHLLVDRDEAVILDMEAGVEHIGRGTAENVDIMLVVSDAHRQSLAIAERIITMAQDAGIPRVALVGNRIQDAGQEVVVREFARARNFSITGIIPYDPAVARAGIAGDSVTVLDGSAALEAIGRILTAIGKDRKE